MQTLKVSSSDRIAVIAIDVPGKPMNVLTLEFQSELGEVIEQLAADESVRGIVITSGKPGAFIAGADIKIIASMLDDGLTAQQGAQLSRSTSKLLRRIETCGKPVACAINGLALGGGCELALACHYRVLAEDATIGLPEVNLGLLPGGGGTQRLPRLIGIEKAEPLLLTGKALKAAEALKLGVVHAVAPVGEVLDKARAWLLGTPSAIQPWDVKGYRIPGGAGPQAPHALLSFTAATALAAQSTQRNYPAALAILSCVYEGTQLTIDGGLGVESKYFGSLLADPVAGNMIRTLFINKNAADKLAARPPGVPKAKVTKLGVLGAGMMGAGIAYVAAKAGITVVLLDATQEQAEKGRQHTAKLEAKKLARGEISQQQLDALMDRITPTSDYAQLAGCDLVVEAVFESRGVKADVARRSGDVLGEAVVFASNTSTLPISELAEAFPRQGDFIGLHFFSPVDKMPLVEVILGRRTSEAALAKALDFVGQIKKTPIVVNDSPGFYTSRVFGAFFQEALLMLGEGVLPALIENAGRAAGMPVGPLAICDEVTMELQLKVIEQNLADGHMNTPQMPAVLAVLRKMVLELKRIGRRGGAGFYDYLPDGKKRLWPGLAEQFPVAAAQPEIALLKQRFLYIQALEAARCMEEGVLTRPADADLGAILGVGFPAWTGGTLSYIDMIGAAEFVRQCEALAAQCGPRFTPCAGLLQKVASGERYLPPMASAA